MQLKNHPILVQSLAIALGTLGGLNLQESRTRVPNAQDRPAEDVLAPRISALEAKVANLSRSGSTLTLSGTNLHVRNGTGATSQRNGRGNVIIGEHAASTGSHNVLVGSMNSATQFGAIVAGQANRSTGEHAHVLGGSGHEASGDFSVIVGGSHHSVTADQAVAAGGSGNQAWGLGTA
ncbi:MAG: hypothetical protein AAGG01_01935, partial [Planctomycetota bacterium]